jgi:hypothetical protein
METRTIPEDQWLEFFDRFSREHAGWLATIDVLDPRAGPQHVAAGLPLQGFSFEREGTRPCSVEVSAGDRPTRQVTHVVDMPLHIREAREAEGGGGGGGGGDVDIQIEPARGPVTLIHLRDPAH